MSSILSMFGRLQDMVHGNGVRYIHQTETFAPIATGLQMSSHDRRMLSKAVKCMDDVMKSCQNHRLNLKNSPPFILDILPETYSLISFAFTKNPNVLQDSYYMRVFLTNMQNKCKQVLKLFKSNSIYEEHSNERRQLTKFSLTFSHMLFELKSQFPDGVCSGDKYRVTKKEANEFWQLNFSKRSLVPWDEFVAALEKLQPISKLENGDLKRTIDLTGDDHVSNFEFDVFTRLFYPWRTLLSNWQLLTNAHPGYVAFLTYDEVKKNLERLSNKPGSYVFRLSCTRPGQWAIGYVAPDGKIYQTIPQHKSLIQALHEGSKEGFYLYPNGKEKDIDLKSHLDVQPADRVTVTSEQYELYSEMGTTFELCKICDDNDKNVIIEPCGHLLCTPCLTSWQESEGGNSCPFCRYEIKGTNKVIITKYNPTKRKEISKSVTYDRPSSTRHETALPLPPTTPPVAPPIPARSQHCRSVTRSQPEFAPTGHPSYVNIPEAPTFSAPPLTMAPTPTTSGPHPPVYVNSSTFQS